MRRSLDRTAPIGPFALPRRRRQVMADLEDDKPIVEPPATVYVDESRPILFGADGRNVTRQIGFGHAFVFDTRRG